MLIYILHGDKYVTFQLPKKVEGSYVLYDYDATNTKRSLVNISAENGKWILKSNSNVYIKTTEANLPSIELQEYNFYSLSAFQREMILLYVAPACDNNYICKQIQGNSTIVFGKDAKADVVYAYQGIDNKQLELRYENGRWYMKNLSPSIPIYVNDKRIDNTELFNLDSIFLLGLKLIIMGSKILISAPPNLVHSMTQKLSEENPQVVVNNYSSNEVFNDFYNGEEYFSKSPVFRKKFSTLKLTITSPDSKNDKGGTNLISSLVPSALMSMTSLLSTYYSIQNYNNGKSDKETFTTNIVMCAVMLITGIVWPIIEYFADKIRSFIDEKRRNFIYMRYLKQKRKILTDARNEQKATLEFNNVSLKECQDIIKTRNAYLFSRNIDQPMFLDIKLGVGRIPMDVQIDYSKPDFMKEKDKLLDAIDKLIEDFKYVDDAPFSFNLKKDNSIAFINSSGDYSSYLNSLIIQLVTFHDYSNLKLVVLTNETSELNKIRNLNHCWNDDRSFRFFANNKHDAENVSSYLIRIFNSRNTKDIDDIKSKTPYYLIISDSIELYKDLKIVENILYQKTPIYFGILMFGRKINDIPDGCSNFVEYSNGVATLFKSEMNESETFKFVPEFMDASVDFSECIKMISNIPIKINNETKGSLPEKLGFLEMFSVGNLEQLNVFNRWKNSSVVNTLAAPIGVDSNGNTLYLDLHEKKHGPHGLIAGTTGSGKSEFIITFILSLAVNYSSDEVQFVLIDYKGGGLAGAFENRKTGIKLPHLVGTITNLDQAEMNRTLVSIKSELQRRQRLFNEAKEQLNTGTIDIYKYQNLIREGTLTEPLSHLFIICDEFAELKAQQPDFMDELVSAARIGRSLGIHLVLATQKPSGVVDEQIWSNSKFKVCCKVQTVEDSQEMLKKPDAAYIKESGRFYLQVGNDEYFVKGQSAYSGVSYIPSETVSSKLDNSISFINNIGETYRNANQKINTTNEQENLGEELNNVLKYIIDVAKEKGYKYHQLWLDNVPKIIYYDYVVKKYNMTNTVFDINPIIGEYDDPKNQKQGAVTLPITFGGNTYIVGASGSGKSSLLSTIIYSSVINHNSEEVNFYIVDLGTEKLRKFQNAPQVGNVLTIADVDYINYLFYMLEFEKNKRQKYYSTTGGDFLSDVKQKKCPFPNIVVIIYEIEIFRETFEDLYDDKLTSFTRNCSKFGINFIVTGTSSTSLGFMMENNFPQKVVLNMVDESDYILFFSNPPIPSKNPGRGLIKIGDDAFEFQVPLIFDEQNEIKNLQYVFAQLNKFLKTKAKSISAIPQEVTFEHIKDSITTLDEVPLGINLVTAQIGSYNFSKHLTIMSSSKVTEIINFSPFLLKVLSSYSNTKVIVLNALKDIKIHIPDGVKYYDSGFKKIIPVLSSNIDKYNQEAKENDSTFIIVVLGYEQLDNYLISVNNEENANLKTIYDLVEASHKNSHFKFILYNTAIEFDKLRSGDISSFIDNTTGLWIGKGFEGQGVFDARPLYNDNVRLGNDSVVLIKSGNVEYVKYGKQ